MISRTRNRLCMGDGDLLLLWGYTTVCVAATIWALLYMTHYPAVNWLWFLIWIIGGIATPHISKKKRIKRGVKSYTDHLSDGIWSIIGWCALICTIICAIFVTVLGTLGHFFYKWSNYNPYIGLLFPVNESPWEHLKLFFFPSLFCYIFLSLFKHSKIPCILYTFPKYLIKSIFVISFEKVSFVFTFL